MFEELILKKIVYTKTQKFDFLKQYYLIFIYFILLYKILLNKKVKQKKT